MKIIIAGFYRPPILAIRQLLSRDISTDDILLLTYGADEGSELKKRNEELIMFAERHDVSYTTAPISEPATKQLVENFNADVLFSLYYRDKIPAAILSNIQYGGINLHASLLPEHKGRFPVSYAICEGDKTTGFTYHYMTSKFDEGRIIRQREVSIEPDDTAYSLYHRLIYAALRRFVDVYDLVTEEQTPGRPQPSGGSYHSELPYNNRINRSWKNEQIERFIRSMYFPPYRPAVVRIGNKEYEVATMSQYNDIISQQ